MLCVHYLYIKANCCPAIWNVWSHMYTQSCLGIPGRDTTTDGFMEKINRYAKRLLNGHITPNRVQTIVPLLNVLLRLIERWTHFMSSNHGGRYVYPGDVSPDADTEKVFKFLCNQHANDLPQAIFPAFQNVFTNKVASGTRINRCTVHFNRDWAVCHTRRHAAIICFQASVYPYCPHEDAGALVAAFPCFFSPSLGTMCCNRNLAFMSIRPFQNWPVW